MDLGISPEDLAEEIQVGLVQRAYRSTLEKRTGSTAGSLRPIEGEGLFTSVDIRQEILCSHPLLDPPPSRVSPPLTWQNPSLRARWPAKACRLQTTLYPSRQKKNALKHVVELTHVVSLRHVVQEGQFCVRLFRDARPEGATEGRGGELCIWPELPIPDRPDSSAARGDEARVFTRTGHQP